MEVYVVAVRSVSVRAIIGCCVCEIKNVRECVGVVHTIPRNSINLGTRRSDERANAVIYSMNTYWHTVIPADL